MAKHQAIACNTSQAPHLSAGLWLHRDAVQEGVAALAGAAGPRQTAPARLTLQRLCTRVGVSGLLATSHLQLVTAGAWAV